MVDYDDLMEFLSVPRPNGSTAERETSQELQGWLRRQGIPFQLHRFRVYPYFYESIGVWLMLSRTVLALGVWLGWWWWTLPIAIIGLLGGTLDILLNLPLVTWIGGRQGENILVEFSPPDPQKELIFSAHYDTKTELLDHRQRMFLLKKMNLGIVLTLLLGFWGPLQTWLAGSPWETLAYWTGLVLAIPMLLLAWGFGLHLSLGRLLEPSQGAVDNGTACAILLVLATELAANNIPLDDCKITLALFTGEEVNMQGSRAYVKSRAWDLPAAAINLEVMAQNGDYIYWEQEGSIFRLFPTSQPLNELYTRAVKLVTGLTAKPFGPVNSDGASFIFAGIPTTTIGTLDKALGESGFHRPTDNLARVVMERIPEVVRILERIIQNLETSSV